MSGGGEDNVGIPDDLRCKRSDGKQWRCTAMSMPDKTVCEKHYIQAKKRAANSAMRANIKKAKRKSVGESDIYLESKSDDMDVPLSSQFGDFSGSSGKKKKKEKISRAQASYSPEMLPVRSFSGRSSLRSTDDVDRDGSEYEDSRRSFRTPTTSAADSDRSRSQKMLDISPTTESSDESTESSDDADGQPCHQCRNNIKGTVIWCLKCDRRGYCEYCISTWYSDIPVEDIQRVCPACRGTCSCRVCMRGDNLIKARIREISAKDKLQYLYSLLSAVLPIVKRIHSAQCSEVELEKRLRGNEIDLARTKLNADEQMCCDFCRVPVIDYHRHCTNCSYDLCLSCCKDIRLASKSSVKEDTDKHNSMVYVKLSDVQLNSFEKFANWQANGDGSIPCPPTEYGGCGSSLLTLKRIFKMNWVAKLVKNVEEMVSGCKVDNSGDPKETGGSLRLLQAAHREHDSDNFLYYPSSEDLKNDGIKDFRMHWRRGKPFIVKEVCDASAMTMWDPMVIWRGIKETAEEKVKDVNRTVKAVDCTDWTEINIELEEFMKGYFNGRVGENGQQQLLKLKDWPSPSASEDFLLYQRPDFISKLPLLEFIHSKWGLLNVAAKLPHYSLQNDVGPKIFISYGKVEEIGEGDSTDNLHLNMRDMVFLLVHTCEVNLKDDNTSEMDINVEAQSDTNALCSDPEIHLNNGELSNLSPAGSNAAEANLHSNDYEKKDDGEIEGSSIILSPAGSNGAEANLHSNNYEKKDDGGIEGSSIILSSPGSNAAEANLHSNDYEKKDDEGVERSRIILSPAGSNAAEANLHSNDYEKKDDEGIEGSSIILSPAGSNAAEANLHSNDYEKKDDERIERSSIIEEKTVNGSEKKSSGGSSEETQAGALWDVFCREDIPKLMDYIIMHWNDFGKGSITGDHVPRCLYDGVVYLNKHHKSKLKEFGVEPWSFEQRIGEAIFIPAGCPYQVRHLQSSVQLGLDFLSPESLAEALRLSEEIRGLPNDHEAKLQMVEVGKISLYAASSAIKEVQKLVLDPKLGAELGFEDPNLTSLVSQNLENIVKRSQITCT